jgi:hypothetical protein
MAEFEPVAINFKHFLQLEACPPAWQQYDLYRIHDGAVTFYVGQSYHAYERVWNHIRSGYKGRSVVGRFIISNWPAAMRFWVELSCSRHAGFASLEYDLNRAEQYLIEKYTPCFISTLNRQPAALPAGYIPPEVNLRVHSLHRMIREATYAIQAEQKKKWLEEDAN